MERIKASAFEAGLRTMVCINCGSEQRLVLQADKVRCQECNATYEIIDGVLDFLPTNFAGWKGDTARQATLRNDRDRRCLRDDTAHVRDTLDGMFRSSSLVLERGCGTGQLARLFLESHPEVTIIATDLSMSMCRFAAENCRDLPVMVVRARDLPFRGSIFDIAYSRLCCTDPEEFYRILRPGRYAVEISIADGQWQELSEVFGEDRDVEFDPRDPVEALTQADFIEIETHSWRYKRIRSMEEIIMTIGYAPILNTFDEKADRPLLSKLEELHGTEAGVRLTEGQSLVVGRKGD